MEEMSNNPKPQYDHHKGMMVKILGFDATEDGEGVEMFLHAVKTHSPEKGCFSTWLYHNLLLRRRQLWGKQKTQIQTIPIENAYGIDGVATPHQIAEFKDSLKILSEDARTIIRCLLETTACSPTKRTKWSTSNTASKREMRKAIKSHCKYTLHWSWPRYWKAVHEIEKFLKD